MNANSRRWAKSVTLWLLLGLGLPAAASAAELLEPEAAFRVTANLVDSRTVEIHYRIADGYYLYRTKFKFVSPDARLKVGLVRFPPGLITEDATFGRVETYRDTVRILVPVAFPGIASGMDLPPFSLQLTSQGCADVGVCYPPNVQSLFFNAAATSTQTPQKRSSRVMNPANTPSPP